MIDTNILFLVFKDFGLQERSLFATDMTSDEEKRWVVVGLASVKVAAPLRDTIQKVMASHYAHLNTHCKSLSPPCELSTLTFSQASKDTTLKCLKFENINGNSQIHGKIKKNYNYSVSSEIELAKLYLPDYLARFSAFDESLDLAAIVRLLGCSKPAPIFAPPIQMAADYVRDNRNKWAHPNFSEWTESFFNDCFSKLEDLVKSVGLPSVEEKSLLDQLFEWQTKGEIKNSRG